MKFTVTRSPATAGVQPQNKDRRSSAAWAPACAGEREGER